MEPDNGTESEPMLNGELSQMVSEIVRKIRRAQGISDEEHKRRLEEDRLQFEKEWREEWTAYWGQPPEAGPVPPELGISVSEWEKEKNQEKS